MNVYKLLKRIRNCFHKDIIRRIDGLSGEIQKNKIQQESILEKELEKLNQVEVLLEEKISRLEALLEEKK